MITLIMLLMAHLMIRHNGKKSLDSFYNNRLSKGEKSLTSVLRIGNLSLDMGNKSDVLTYPKNEVDYKNFLRYMTYQLNFK